MAKYKESKAAPKPQNDAYTVMLIITLLAVLVGCTLLYLDNDEYGKNPPPKESVPALPKLGDAAPKGGGAAVAPEGGAVTKPGDNN